MKAQIEKSYREITREESPFDIEFFMIQGIGFRCMGYRDEQGKWRSAFSHVELLGNIRLAE